MKNAFHPLLSCLLAITCTHPLCAQVLLYERCENAVEGQRRGNLSFTDEVVGWGGLTTEPNRFAVVWDGAPETCLDIGSEKQITAGDFTVEAFVKLSEPGDYAAIAADWSEEGNQRSWALMVTPRGGLRFDISPDGAFHPGNKLESPPRLIEPGHWYHVAAVSAGRVSRLFVNGHQVAECQRATEGIFTGDKAHLKIGNVDSYATRGPRPWRGALDEVRITLAVLSPEQFLRTREPMPEPTGPVPRQFVMPFVAHDQAAAEQWQADARRKLFELVERRQPRRSTQEVPLNFQLGESIDKDSYTLYHATYQGNEKQPIRCLLAVPKGTGPFPAMLALHGHGGSCDVVFDTTSIYHGFADRFARGGYVVLAPSFEHREYCATNLWNLIRAVDVLESRADVAADRLGVGGLSMGGEWTMWTAACDPRLKAAVVSGWMCTTEGVFAVPNCPCWELPGFVDLMDVCEVHLLIAPRPVLFESAERDECFPIAYTRQGFARIRAGYEVWNAADKVAQDTWPAGHEWHGVSAYPFIDRLLGGHAAAK